MLPKKRIISIFLIFITLIVLFVPYQKDVFNDGGTTIYTALTYQIIKPSRFAEDQTVKFRFAINGKTLFEKNPEQNKHDEQEFIATILEINGDTVLVKPFDNEEELNSSDKISFNIKNLEPLYVNVGSIVQITYTGEIMESYPAQIDAVSWSYPPVCEHF